jgi:hypothetical protein
MVAWFWFIGCGCGLSKSGGMRWIPWLIMVDGSVERIIYGWILGMSDRCVGGNYFLSFFLNSLIKSIFLEQTIILSSLPYENHKIYHEERTEENKKVWGENRGTGLRRVQYYI